MHFKVYHLISGHWMQYKQISLRRKSIQKIHTCICIKRLYITKRRVEGVRKGKSIYLRVYAYCKQSILFSLSLSLTPTPITPLTHTHTHSRNRCGSSEHYTTRLPKLLSARFIFCSNSLLQWSLPTPFFGKL